MEFLRAAFQLSRNSIYSLHKSSTRGGRAGAAISRSALPIAPPLYLPCWAMCSVCAAEQWPPSLRRRRRQHSAHFADIGLSSLPRDSQLNKQMERCRCG